MNATFSCCHRIRATLIVFSLCTVAGPNLAAQTVAAKVPELFAGELDDVGPQFLLLPKPVRQPIDLWTELEFTETSNATLVEQNPSSSTITSAQAGATWSFMPRPVRGGNLTFESGMRAQAYRYGYFAGRKKVVNYLEIDRNDFDLLGAHLGARWEREQWFAGVAIRGAALRNRTNDRVFYKEGSFEWQLFRQGRLSPQRSWALGLEGAARISNTDSMGLLPAGWNNRVEQSFVALIEQRLGTHWRLQPALRVLGAKYTHRDRHRSDVNPSGRLTAVYRLTANADVRLAVGYDQRESSEPSISDFKKWDLGLSGGAHWRF